MKKMIKGKSNAQSSKKIVKPIKLEVKNNRKRTFSLKDIFKNLKGLTIFLIIVLFIMSICLIVSIVKVQRNKITIIKDVPSLINEDNGLFSTWVSNNDEILSFNSDLSFDYIMNNEENYKGEFTYNVGLDALRDMGYSMEEFNKSFAKEINHDNVYSLKLVPTKEDNDNDEWWIIFIIKDDGSAIAYNKSLDIRYTLSKR